MTFFIFLAIALALVWWFSGWRASGRNERLYLKRRGYQPDQQQAPPEPVSKDSQIASLIASLTDLSPYSRERAVQELERRCASGLRDSRVLEALVQAVEDNDPSVRRAAARALGTLGEPEAVEAIRKRLEVEESVAVRTVLQRSLNAVPPPELGT
jgi:hypothetical protein